MSALAELQRGFAARVLRADATDRFAAAIVGSAAAGSDERLHVYEHAYRARLVEVLGNDFPSLRALAGDEAFDRLANEYVAATPSHHFNVRWYGARLAAFLRGAEQWREVPGLADMAALEWAIGLSFDAADEGHVDVDEVARIAPEQWATMGLRLHAAIQRLELRCNVGEIRRAIDHRQDAPALRDLGIAQAWIVSRQEQTVRYRRLDADEAAALDAAANDASFADICDVLCQWHEPDEVALRAATLFRAWVQNQWIAELRLDQ